MRSVGQTSDASLLDQTLQEEKHADEVLTGIAERVNTSAENAA